MRETARSVAGPDSGPELLAPALVEAMRDTGACVGGVYLLRPGERVLRLALLSGVPWEIAAPWARATLGAPTPVTDALRERRLVWLGGQEEVARRYPQLALVLPYFYDLIRLDDTTAAAAIGDVQGHNVQAAALMGQVRTAVHATAGSPPGEVLARTNRLLTDLDPGLFTSCLYAHLDLARHTACLASAGHPWPVLRHPDGHTEVLHPPPGLLLGIDPTATYPATEIPLPPGAVLLLYTDGLVEVPGVDLDEVTDALAVRLARAGDLEAEALADALVRDAWAHRSDDVALLLLHATA